MSLKSSIAIKLGLSDINASFINVYNLSFLIQNSLDNNKKRRQLLKKVRDYTHVNYQRLKFLWDAAQKIALEQKFGAFVETGVWKGGCAGILSYISKQHNYKYPLYFFDSFEGLPEPTLKDGKDAITFSNSKNTGNLESIKKVSADDSYIKKLLFNDLKINPDFVTIVKGWFQDTIAINKEKIREIAILRLDGDWYESTKIPLEQLYDKVISGGYVIIDDYYYWDGCKKAVDDFVKENDLNVEIKRQDSSGAYFIKH